MLLRNIEFGSVFAASGSRGFFGEGYFYHKYIPGLNYNGSVFISKTATLESNPGNMALVGIKPTKLFPKCIRVKHNAVINAVGLSNPGLVFLLEQGIWQKNTKPFVISIHCIGPNEAREIVELLQTYKFVTTPAIQLNISCPNLENYYSFNEISEIISEFSFLDWPIIIKINSLFSIELAEKLSLLPYVDAISVGNSLPWNSLPSQVKQKIFNERFPLDPRFGNFGLSGHPYVFTRTKAWVQATKFLQKPVIAGGGILCLDQAKQLKDCGAAAIELGCISILRPWRIKSLIKGILNYG